MKLGNIFKYGLLATCLLGHIQAMEKNYVGNGFGDYFNGHCIDIGTVHEVFVRNHALSQQEYSLLAQTCKSWKTFIDGIVPSKDYSTEININIHPDLYHSYSGEIYNFSCTSHLLFIFLPYQEGVSSDNATTWSQTAGWTINGYTGQIQRLPTFTHEVTGCFDASHPQSIYFTCLNQPIKFLTVTEETVRVERAFQGTEMAEITDGNFPRFRFNANGALVLKKQTDGTQQACIYSDDMKVKGELTLATVNSTIYNFGKNFLVTGIGPNSLHVINCEDNTLEAMPISLPVELASPTTHILNLTSDRDDVLITAQEIVLQQPDFICKPKMIQFLIRDLSSPNPTTKPVTFFPKGYKPVHSFLKNNFTFSVSELIREVNPSLESSDLAEPKDGDTYEVNIPERNMVFSIYDLNHKLMYMKHFASKPLRTYFVGNTIFVESITKEIHTFMGNWYLDLSLSPHTLWSFNVCNYLVRKDQI